jgi:hypothetical protein
LGSFPKSKGSNPFSAIFILMLNNFFFSPLEQFDNASWVYFDLTFQNKDLPLTWLDIFELDYAYANNATLKVSQTSSLIIVLVVVTLGYLVLNKVYPDVASTLKNIFTSLNKDFSILFLKV